MRMQTSLPRSKTATECQQRLKAVETLWVSPTGRRSVSYFIGHDHGWFRTDTPSEFPLDYLNGTEIFVTASDAHNSDDTAPYNSAIQQVWPVLTVWGYNNRANASDGTKPTVQLTCVRANNNSSDNGGGNPENTAPSSQSSAISALVVAGLAAIILL